MYRLTHPLSMGQPNWPIINWAFLEHYHKQLVTKHEIEGIDARYFKYLGTNLAEIERASIQ